MAWGSQGPEPVRIIRNSLSTGATWRDPANPLDIWSLWFDDCTSPDACRSLQFYRGFVHAGLTNAALREFSRTHSPARAYRDSEGDVALERNLTIESDGLDRATFAAVIQAWETTLRDLSRLAN